MYDNKLALMAGIDIPIPELQLVIHQPTIKEIAYIGDTDFFLGVQCLSIRKEMVLEDKTLLSTMNNFQIFMKIMTEKEAKDKKDATQSVLQLIMPGYKILFTPRSMMISKDQTNIIIDENNFDYLQDAVRLIFCATDSQDQGFNPSDEKAKQIAAKLMQGRQRVAAEKKAEEGNGSIFSQYLSVLTVGIGSMSLDKCLNLTMYQMFDLIKRYSLWLDWDLDIRSRLAGASGEGKPDNWMKNIH